MSYWDGRYLASGLVFIDVGSVIVQGAIREIRYNVGTTSLYSDKYVPANSRIVYVALVILNVYNTGTTISIGYDGVTSAIMTTTENDPTKNNIYDLKGDELMPAVPTKILTTINGVPVNGLATVIVWHTIPEN